VDNEAGLACVCLRDRDPRAGKRSGMSTPQEPLTPLAVETRLRHLVNDLTKAQADLRKARDDEVDARHKCEAVRRAALLSDESPKVTRGGYTTAERDAWVDDQCADLKFDADKATVVREAAQDRLRVLLAQAEIVRSLGASVRQAYELAGASAA
jgi:hypothetical protein